MSKYITLFDTHTDYQTYINGQDKVLPNVSYCKNQKEVHYNPTDTKLVCKYNIIDTTSATVLRTPYEQNIFKSMEIDGVLLDSLVTEYQFSTTGEHVVKYELYDETKVGNNSPLFYNITALTSVFIPDSVTTIGNNTFQGCSGLTSIKIPDNVTSIGQVAFLQCSGLTSVTIGNSVTTIGNYAFQNCSSLTSIKIPNSLTSIGDYVFNACNSLTTVTIPDNITSIGGNAFSACSSLTSVTIPNSVTSIGVNAFNQCSSLTSVTVQATTPPTINSGAFGNNASGRKIYVPSESVDTYKATSGWFGYASDIEAIP